MAWVAAHNVVVSCCGASGWCEYEQASDIVYPFNVMVWDWWYKKFRPK